jgi:DNA-binding NarL/FixJ family response regulator
MTMISKIAVFLVAGKLLLREALARLLSQRGDFDVCGVSLCGPEVTSCIATLGSDVLGLNSIAVQLSDYALIPVVAKQAPNMKVVLIVMDDDPEVFLECVRAGAAGYLLKDAFSADVISAVCSVAPGQTIWPSQRSMPLIQTVAQPWTAVPSSRSKLKLGLTRRQQELVPLLAQGLTNEEIASHLNLSEQTVKNQIPQMPRCVGASNRLQVIDLPRSRGIFR